MRKIWFLIGGAAALIVGSLGLGLAALKFLRRHVEIQKIDIKDLTKEERLYSHARVIQIYELLDEEEAKRAKMDHEQYLNTMFYPTKNLVILTSKFARNLYKECFENAGIDEEKYENWNDQEIEQAWPPIICEDADVYRVTFPDGAVMYRIDHNIPFKLLEEGDEEDDFYQ